MGCAALSEDAEGLVTAEIDLDAIMLSKAAADPVGHYSRPDVFRLMFNRSRGERVVPHGAPAADVATEQSAKKPALIELLSHGEAALAAKSA